MKSRGMSLLEILLVLAVSAVVTLSALRVVRLLEFKADVEKLKNTVELTLIMMNDYYVAPSTNPIYPHNCLDPALTAATFSMLLSNAPNYSILTPNEITLLDYTKTKQPFGVTQQINFMADDPNNPKHYNFVVKDFFPNEISVDQIQLIRAQLNGDADASGNSISWTRVPNQTLTNGLDNDLWVAMSAHDTKLAQYRDPTKPPNPNITFCPI